MLQDFGLQVDFQNFLIKFKPVTVLAAYKLALIYEESIYLDYFPEPDEMLEESIIIDETVEEDSIIDDTVEFSSIEELLAEETRLLEPQMQSEDNAVSRVHRKVKSASALEQKGNSSFYLESGPLSSSYNPVSATGSSKQSTVSPSAIFRSNGKGKVFAYVSLQLLVFGRHIHIFLLFYDDDRLAPLTDFFVAYPMLSNIQATTYAIDPGDSCSDTYRIQNVSIMGELNACSIFVGFLDDVRCGVPVQSLNSLLTIDGSEVSTSSFSNIFPVVDAEIHVDGYVLMDGTVLIHGLNEKWNSTVQILVLAKYPYLIESYFVNCCFNGLQDDIKQVVQLFLPLLVKHAFSLANKVMVSDVFVLTKNNVTVDQQKNIVVGVQEEVDLSIVLLDSRDGEEDETQVINDEKEVGISISDDTLRRREFNITSNPEFTFEASRSESPRVIFPLGDCNSVRWFMRYSGSVSLPFTAQSYFNWEPGPVSLMKNENFYVYQIYVGTLGLLINGMNRHIVKIEVLVWSSNMTYRGYKLYCPGGNCEQYSLDQELVMLPQGRFLSVDVVVESLPMTDSLVASVVMVIYIILFMINYYAQYAAEDAYSYYASEDNRSLRPGLSTVVFAAGAAVQKVNVVSLMCFSPSIDTLVLNSVVRCCIECLVDNKQISRLFMLHLDPSPHGLISVWNFDPGIYQGGHNDWSHLLQSIVAAFYTSKLFTTGLVTEDIFYAYVSSISPFRKDKRGAAQGIIVHVPSSFKALQSYIIEAVYIVTNMGMFFEMVRMYTCYVLDWVVMYKFRILQLQEGKDTFHIWLEKWRSHWGGDKSNQISWLQIKSGFSFSLQPGPHIKNNKTDMQFIISGYGLVSPFVQQECSDGHVNYLQANMFNRGVKAEVLTLTSLWCYLRVPVSEGNHTSIVSFSMDSCSIYRRPTGRLEDYMSSHTLIAVSVSVGLVLYAGYTEYWAVWVFLCFDPGILSSVFSGHTSDNKISWSGRTGAQVRWFLLVLPSSQSACLFSLDNKFLGLYYAVVFATSQIDQVCGSLIGSHKACISPSSLANILPIPEKTVTGCLSQNLLARVASLGGVICVASGYSLINRNMGTALYKQVILPHNSLFPLRSKNLEGILLACGSRLEDFLWCIAWLKCCFKCSSCCILTTDMNHHSRKFFAVPMHTREPVADLIYVSSMLLSDTEIQSSVSRHITESTIFIGSFQRYPLLLVSSDSLYLFLWLIAWAGCKESLFTSITPESSIDLADLFWAPTTMANIFSHICLEDKAVFKVEGSVRP